MDRESISYCHTVAELENLAQKCEFVIVNCYSDWCPACSQMKPVFERLAEQFGSECSFIKVRTDEDEELDRVLRIRVIPTFLLIANKTVVDIIEGSVGERALREAVVRLLRVK